jgi:outer membrane protein assembly factor BamD
MTQRLACLLLVFIVAATATGCAARRDRAAVDPTENARVIYQNATGALRSGNYAAAIGGLENLTAIYPFSEEARQARLDLMYAYWRNDEPDNAVAAADRFILENPTHPRVDYAVYMKGLARFPRGAGPLERLFRSDIDKRPPGDMQTSFNSFAQLLQQFPESQYAEDARQRMIYLRNRLATHEIRVAEFYQDRHAHVAAINRARTVLENYQETPAVHDALRIMAEGYDRLGLDELAADTRRVIAANAAAGGRR